MIRPISASRAHLAKMASDEESLRALEALMTEFFDTRTTNERKREIEELLNNFSQQQGAWQHCLYFMANTNNEFVMMYCMTVLENLINRQWIGLLREDKIEIRSTLNKFLLNNHRKVANFIRNKLVKLVVDIGRLDWPHFYPDFFSNTIQLIQQPDTTTLGLILLHTTSEELACPREDLSVSRKEELQRLLLDQVPTVLGLLSGILDSMLEKHRHVVTATPPPSPTHGQSDSSRSLFSTSPLHTGSLLSSMFKSLSNKNPFQSLPPMDSESHYISCLTLNCLSHLFSWIPLSAYITSSLLTTIFHFASLGCDGVRTIDGHTPSGPSLGVLAMGCINEILSKNCVPVDFEDFLLQMFQNTFHLLQKLVKDNASSGPNTNAHLAELEESYLEKFTEFLRLFVNVHLRRFESNSHFPVLEFLALLFKYTFQQPSNESFYSCLDIWNVFLDYLTTQLKNRQADRYSIMDRYKDALVSLVTQIQRKSLFRFNQAQLEELDDESLDDDSETEWQHFLRQCLEIVAKVAELMPEETFQILYPQFQENLEVYLGLEHCITVNAQGRNLNVTAENECRRLHCMLRDLSSLLQALGRLADQFIGEAFVSRGSTAQRTVESLCHTALYGSRLRLFEVNTAVPTVLKPDFIEVHAQTLASLKAYSHWMAQFYSESVRQEPLKEQFLNMMRLMIDATVPMINNEIPEKIVHSAAHLLVSLTSTIRPANFFQLPLVQQLYGGVGQGHTEQLNFETQLLLYRALSNILILPLFNVSESEQQWSVRSEHHVNFVKRLTASYQQIKDTPNYADNKVLQEQAKPVTKRTLHISRDMIENVSGEVSKTKQLCYQSLHDVIHTTVVLFPVFIHQSDVIEEVVSFFLSVFEVLHVHMGVPFAEQVVQTFMSSFTREQLAETILQESNIGSRVIEKFLKILQLIIQEPGMAFKAFLPSTISVCMDQIYPMVATRASPDVKPSLFDLLHNILLHNWRYFFKTNVLTSLGGQTGNEPVENEHQFTAIMQAFGHSFLQPDISIFQQNLEALENLNRKCKLYYKAIFKQVMLGQFLNVLIQTLIHKSHDLLQEEICITVYNMASVEFDTFFTTFIPQFLQNCEGLDDNQKSILSQNFKHDTDLPSFTHNLHRFVNDLRYYRLCNSSLPAGSVKL